MSSSASIELEQFKGNVDSFQLPWVEKYRPRVLDDIVGNEAAIARLKVIANTGNMPNLLLSGAPGIGKTTSIVCLGNTMLGDKAKEAILELNASDDRGIDVVRNRIKAFSKMKLTLPPGQTKIVVLDEADSMTSSAQQALRRIMEMYSNITRFALACNQPNKLIEPIQSRCVILRFNRLSNEQVLKRLLEICKLENVKYNDEGLSSIIYTADGDMRQAINNLQSTWSAFNYVNSENVFKVCDTPHPHIVSQIIEYSLLNNIDEALKYLTQLWDFGYSAVDIVTTFFRVTKTFPGITEDLKLQMIYEIGNTHMMILEGVQSLLQLAGLVARLCKMSRQYQPPPSQVQPQLLC